MSRESTRNLQKNDKFSKKENFSTVVQLFTAGDDAVLYQIRSKLHQKWLIAWTGLLDTIWNACCACILLTIYNWWVCIRWVRVRLSAIYANRLSRHSKLLSSLISHIHRHYYDETSAMMTLIRLRVSSGELSDCMPRRTFYRKMYNDVAYHLNNTKKHTKERKWKIRQKSTTTLLRRRRISKEGQFDL